MKKLSPAMTRRFDKAPQIMVQRSGGPGGPGIIISLVWKVGGEIRSRSLGYRYPVPDSENVWAGLEILTRIAAFEMDTEVTMFEVESD